MLKLTCTCFVCFIVTKTIDGHHKDSVECVLGEISEGVLCRSTGWDGDQSVTTVIDSDIVAGRNTTSSGRGPGHSQLL